MIAKLHAVVLDTADPSGLAEFYRSLLGGHIESDAPDWYDLIDDGRTIVAFQLAPDLVAPRWPDPAYPQQFHLDVTVDDLDEGQAAVEAIGGIFLSDGGSFRVMNDPAGHPFCICLP